MLRRFGNLVWRQTRDMSVLNYSNHLVYEIYTNHGYLYVAHDKATGKIEVINGIPVCIQDSEVSKLCKNQSEATLFPHLQ